MFCVGFVANLICVVGVNLTRPGGHLLPSLFKKREQSKYNPF